MVVEKMDRVWYMIQGTGSDREKKKGYQVLYRPFRPMNQKWLWLDNCDRMVRPPEVLQTF
jgi:hypothetical protein